MVFLLLKRGYMPNLHTVHHKMHSLSHFIWNGVETMWSIKISLSTVFIGSIIIYFDLMDSKETFMSWCYRIIEYCKHWHEYWIVSTWKMSLHWYSHCWIIWTGQKAFHLLMFTSLLQLPWKNIQGLAHGVFIL